MNEINIKCDNQKEAEYVEKYFLEKGRKLATYNKPIKDLDEQKYPIIFWTSYDVNNVDYSTKEFFDFSFNYNNKYKIIDTKILMREEKLKRING